MGFQNSVCKITLNQITDIPFECYEGFFYHNSIEEGLPWGYVNINDTSGAILAKFENLQIGAEIQVVLIDIKDELEFPFGDQLVVLNVETDFNKKPDSFVGQIRVWFGHAWFIYKDIKNHAYQPMNSTKLIKKILESKDRGMKFLTADEYLSETDDEGTISRYKVAETDWDFIQNKILPYCAINQLPAHFFSNGYGFLLKSFQELYTQNPVAIYIPQEGNLTNQEQIEKIKKYLESNNIKVSYPISEAYLQIGELDSLKDLYPIFYFEHLDDGTVLTGQKRLGNKVSQRSGANFGNLIPLDQKFMLNSTGSGVKIIRNRQAVDSFSLLFETAKHLDFFFSLIIVSSFTGLLVGQTVSIFVNFVAGDDGKDKEHWISGKWMVSSIEHYSNPENPKQVFSKTHLVRPNFIGNNNKTSLRLSAMMYEAI